MPIQLDVTGMTDPGVVRRDEPNQDCYYVATQAGVPQALLDARGALFMVADGVGGHQGGQHASDLAVRVVSQSYYADANPDLQASLRAAVEEANRAIKHESISSPSYFGMGTTVTAVVIRGAELYLAHVGDSRAYRLRQGQLQRLTNDHSVAEEGLRRGLFGPQEAANHPQKNVLTRSLGAELHVDVDISPDPQGMRNGDVLLLCSDGLTNAVQDGTLAQVLASSRNSAHAVQHLINLANQGGGPDNITAVVVRNGAPRAGRVAPPPRPVGPSPQGRATTHLPLVVLAVIAIVTLAGGVALVASRRVPVPVVQPMPKPVASAMPTMTPPSKSLTPTTPLPSLEIGKIEPVEPAEGATFSPDKAPKYLKWSARLAEGQKFKLTFDGATYELSKDNVTPLEGNQFGYVRPEWKLNEPGAHKWGVEIVDREGKSMASGGPWTFTVQAPPAPVPTRPVNTPTPTPTVTPPPTPSCQNGKEWNGTECVCPKGTVWDSQQQWCADIGKPEGPGRP